MNIKEQELVYKTIKNEKICQLMQILLKNQSRKNCKTVFQPESVIL